MSTAPVAMPWLLRYGAFCHGFAKKRVIAAGTTLTYHLSALQQTVPLQQCKCIMFPCMAWQRVVGLRGVKCFACRSPDLPHVQQTHAEPACLGLVNADMHWLALLMPPLLLLLLQISTSVHQVVRTSAVSMRTTVFWPTSPSALTRQAKMPCILVTAQTRHSTNLTLEVMSARVSCGQSKAAAPTMLSTTVHPQRHACPHTPPSWGPNPHLVC